MRSLYRQTIHIACLATLTMIVLVACSSGPGIAAPTVGEGAPGSVDFDAGQETETLALSEVFTGQNLTFSDPKSSKPAVATASIANGILTITAVSPGAATITVTATNARGSVSHEITVTVPESAPTVRTGALAAVEFDQGQTTSTVSLSSVFTGQNLTFSDPKSSKPAVATASIANGILTITAVSPGAATITVTATNARGSKEHKITVTVPATSGPAAPTVRAGAPTSVAFDQGQTIRSISLRGVVFTGENLTFDIESDTPSVAIASISNGILIITAGDPGEATITVTATNTRGRVSHEITITVPGLITTPPTTPPTTSSCKSPLTIKLHKTAMCTLSSKEQILTSDPDEVTVVRSPGKDTEWSIRAEKKGIHKVSIIGTGASNSGEKLGEITVEVPNSHPILQNADDEGILIGLAANTPMNTHKLPLPTAHFSDPDGTTDVKYYRIASKPDWFLIDTEDGFVMDGDDNDNEYQLNYEVLKEVKEGVENIEYDFTVSLYGSDGEDDSALPLVLKFNAPSGGLLPRDVAYSLNQRGDKDNFYNDVTLDDPPANKLDVGPRRGVRHTVTFTLPDEDATLPDEDATGFGFANSLHKKWKDDGDGKLPLDDSVTTTDAHYLGEDGNYVPRLPNEKGEANKDKRAEGINYFILKSTGAVVVKRVTVSGEPVVVFELKETGSSGTIKIEYYVWILSRDQEVLESGAADDEDDPRNMIGTIKKNDSRTLTINVVKCSSPPDPIAACP